jgi:hypothetical protein
MAGGQCANAQLTQAVREVAGRAPQDSDSNGECNPAVYSPGGQWSSYRDLINKVTVHLTGKGAAYVAIAPTLALGEGHIAWAYINNDGTYEYGATDAPRLTDRSRLEDRRAIEAGTDNAWGTIPKGPDTNTPWREQGVTEAQMFAAFRGHYGSAPGYTEVKFTFVASRNQGAADLEALRIRDVGYGLWTNNCLDDGNVMQWKWNHPAPNSWFNAFGYMNANGQITKVDNGPGEAL